jgi:hypothetical protein
LDRDGTLWDPTEGRNLQEAIKNIAALVDESGFGSRLSRHEFAQKNLALTKRWIAKLRSIIGLRACWMRRMRLDLR